MVGAQSIRTHLDKLPFLGKVIGGCLTAVAAIVAIAGGIQGLSGSAARAQILLSERNAICKDIYSAGNGYWRTMVQFSRNASLAGELSDQQILKSLKGFHPELQTRYRAMNDAVVAAKTSFSAGEEAQFRKYTNAMIHSQEVAWIAVNQAPSAWSASTRGFFLELNRTGRQNSGANYTSELDPICNPD
jgi:hypothetical protein